MSQKYALIRKLLGGFPGAGRKEDIHIVPLTISCNNLWRAWQCHEVSHVPSVTAWQARPAVAWHSYTQPPPWQIVLRLKHPKHSPVKTPIWKILNVPTRLASDIIHSYGRSLQLCSLASKPRLQSCSHLIGNWEPLDSSCCHFAEFSRHLDLCGRWTLWCGHSPNNVQWHFRAEQFPLV